MIGLVVACGQCGSVGTIQTESPFFCGCGRVYVCTGRMGGDISIVQGPALTQNLPPELRKKTTPSLLVPQQGGLVLPS